MRTLPLIMIQNQTIFVIKKTQFYEWDYKKRDFANLIIGLDLLHSAEFECTHHIKNIYKLLFNQKKSFTKQFT